MEEEMAPIVSSGLRVASIALSRATAPVEVREQLAYQDWAGLLATWTSSVTSSVRE